MLALHEKKEEEEEVERLLLKTQQNSTLSLRREKEREVLAVALAATTALFEVLPMYLLHAASGSSGRFMRTYERA